MANTAWAFATTAGVVGPGLFGAIAVEATKRIAEFSAQNMAKTVCAFATADVTGPGLLKAIAAEAPKRIAAFDPQSVANTIWAFATAGVPGPELF